MLRRAGVEAAEMPHVWAWSLAFGFRLFAVVFDTMANNETNQRNRLDTAICI